MPGELTIHCLLLSRHFRFNPCDETTASVQAEGGWLRRVTGAWQAGRLSNLDYLLFLNLAAGRSFCDLAQWPVAPWVVADYASQSLDLSDPR